MVDRDGRLVGIVSRGDLLKVFLRDDDGITTELRRLIADQPGADPDRVTVLVTDGSSSSPAGLNGAPPP